MRRVGSAWRRGEDGKAVLKGCGGDAGMRWSFVPLLGGGFAVRNEGTGMVLEAADKAQSGVLRLAARPVLGRGRCGVWWRSKGGRLRRFLSIWVRGCIGWGLTGVYGFVYGVWRAIKIIDNSLQKSPGGWSSRNRNGLNVDWERGSGQAFRSSDERNRNEEQDTECAGKASGGRPCWAARR